MLKFDVPQYKKIRVIIDTDAACEADDPFAIVQGLLSPKLMVRGILAEHFRDPDSVERSYQEIMTILDAMNIQVPVFRGQAGPLTGEDEPSDAVKFLIDEGMKQEDAPLFVLCQGAITNVALAMKLQPQIISKMTVIWIGTHGEAPCQAPFREFNAGNDVTAANIVLQSGTDLWLVPSQVYSTITIGIAEIQRRIRPCGRIGAHLFQNLVDYNMSEYAGWTQGESWSLGDSPAIAIAINPGCGRYRMIHAPIVSEDTSSLSAEDTPMIRLYTEVDSRYILEDLIAKLELFTQDSEE